MQFKDDKQRDRVYRLLDVIRWAETGAKPGQLTLDEMMSRLDEIEIAASALREILTERQEAEREAAIEAEMLAEELADAAAEAAQ